MKLVALIIGLLLTLKCYCQEIEMRSIYNRHEITITVTCVTDSATFFKGSFEVTGKFVCHGNVVRIDKSRVSKLQDTIVLDLAASDSVNEVSEQINLKYGDVLKIRFLRSEHIRIPKNKKLKICLTLNNQRYTFFSKRYYQRFCHRKNVHAPEYLMLAPEEKDN